MSPVLVAKVAIALDRPKVTGLAAVGRDKSGRVGSGQHGRVGFHQPVGWEARPGISAHWISHSPSPTGGSPVALSMENPAFVVSRVVSRSASPIPCRCKRRHLGRISSTSPRGGIPGFQIFGFSGARKRNPVSTHPVTSEPPTNRSPELSFRIRHLVMGRRRFGTGSGSGQFRVD